LSSADHAAAGCGLPLQAEVVDINERRIGTREGLELDFKRKVNTLADGSDDHFEMAKDLAALAECPTPVAVLELFRSILPAWPLVRPAFSVWVRIFA
jgi:hypothetical protein